MNYILISLIFNIMDYISGLLKGLRQKNFSSKQLRKGLFNKTGFILCYVLFFSIDKFASYIDLQLPLNVLPVLCGYVILTEITSIIENIHGINPNILPQTLHKFLSISDSDKEK